MHSQEHWPAPLVEKQESRAGKSVGSCEDMVTAPTVGSHKINNDISSLFCCLKIYLFISERERERA